MIIVGEGVIGVEVARVHIGRSGSVVQRGEIFAAIVVVVFDDFLPLLHLALDTSVLLGLASFLFSDLGVRGVSLRSEWV